MSPREPKRQVAVIGGSGFYRLEADDVSVAREFPTPFSNQPVALQLEHTSAGACWFLARHGSDHSIAPHLVNYRANLWALREAGASVVVAVNAVGGIATHLAPGALVLPDQIVDYTWGREHTFCTGTHALERHVDFTWPYDAELAQVLQESAQMLDIPLYRGATYAATQGPRLESAAEIRRLRNDGCDIVGMTGMPEAALARELGLRYVCIALVVNKAAGLGEGAISQDEMARHLASGMQQVRAVLLAALPRLRA
jgi:5'-methylthioinosine phosphorylase